MNGTHRHHSVRQQFRLAASVVLLVALLAAPWLASAQADAGSFEVYQSPEFGYLFAWDTSEWAVDDHSVEPGSDRLQLSSDSSIAVIWGYSEPGVTAEDCLLEAISQIESDPTLVRYQSLSAPETPPEPFITSEGLSAGSGLILAFDTPDGKVTYAAVESCASTIPGEQLLYMAEWMLAEAYNEKQTLGRIFDNLIPSRSTWTFTDQVAFPDGPQGLAAKYRPTLLVDSSGNELGMLSVHRYYDCVNGSSSADWIAAENSGTSPLGISPDAFAAVSREGEVWPDPVVHWLYPALASSESVILEPGERALLVLDHPVIGFNQLFYIDQEGFPLDLGWNGGCGGGGTAPPGIDMDQ